MSRLRTGLSAVAIPFVAILTVIAALLAWLIIFLTNKEPRE